MSSQNPPSEPQHPEYLEQGAGAPLPADGRRGRARLVVAGGAVAALAMVGGGVWAALSFFGTGAQPAEALPAGTIGYAAVDLDPAGGQKIAAIRTLREFPAFREEVGLDTDDDVKEAIFDALGVAEECPGVDYGDDLEPWLGDRFAVAAVDLGEEEPTAVGVLQVSDEAAAGEGLTALRECSGDGGSPGWVIDDGWAVLAETEAIAEDVVATADEGSLADDEDFARWTGETGDAGVVTLYAAPEAGAFLAEVVHPLSALGLGAGGVPGSCVDTEEGHLCDDSATSDEPAVPEEVRSRLEDFAGAAATLRFADGAVELEAAGDATFAGEGLAANDRGDDLVATLPEDTTVAVGLGLTEGWFASWFEQMSAAAGSDTDAMIAEVEAFTGLSLPEDVEALLGDAMAVAVGPGLDPEAMADGPDEGRDVAVKVAGDPADVEAALDKVNPFLSAMGFPLGSDAGDGSVVIGPNPDYRAELLEGGRLGDTDAFSDVVAEAEVAGAVLFVDLDAEWLTQVADTAVAENLAPLRALGASVWVDGEVAHGVLRVTTD